VSFEADQLLFIAVVLRYSPLVKGLALSRPIGMHLSSDPTFSFSTLAAWVPLGPRWRGGRTDNDDEGEKTHE